MKNNSTKLSPCGVVCSECHNFSKKCSGCSKICGKVFWLKHINANVCPIYQCCKNKGNKNCGKCPKLPCEFFTKDPTFSDEENEENLKKILNRLKHN